MPSFCSFLVFRQEEIEIVRAICVGAGWPAHSIVDPSKRYRFTTSGMTEASQASALPMFGDLHDGEQYGQLLVFESGQDEANNIIELIRAANLILEGFPDRFELSGHGFEIPDDATERQEIFELVFRRAGYFERFTSRETLLVAVAVAACVFRDDPATDSDSIRPPIPI